MVSCDGSVRRYPEFMLLIECQGWMDACLRGLSGIGGGQSPIYRWSTREARTMLSLLIEFRFGE